MIVCFRVYVYLIPNTYVVLLLISPLVYTNKSACVVTFVRTDAGCHAGPGAYVPARWL